MSLFGILGGGLVSKGIDYLFDQKSSSANSARSWRYAQKQMAEQYRYNEMAAENSFNRSMKAWQLENEYNSPKAYMERLKDAGLNPWSAAGASFHNASLSSPDQSGVSAPSVNTRPSTFQSIATLVNVFQDMKEKEARINLIEQDKKLKQGQFIESLFRSLESMKRGEGYGIRNQISSFQFGIMKDLKQTTIDTARRRAELLGENIGLAKWTRMLKEKEARDYLERGVRPNDSIWVRLVNSILDRFGIGLSTFLN